MKPHLFKFEDLAPVSMQRPDLHEHACRFAEQSFADKGSAPFMWIIAAGTRLVWVETPWENEGEKDFATYVVRRMLKGLGAHAYVFMSEAWVAQETKGDKYWEMREAGLPVPLPGERPENERDDILMVTSFDRDGRCGLTRYLVTIKRHGGLNRLGLRVDVDPGEFNRFEGRMWDLLGWAKKLEAMP